MTTLTDITHGIQRRSLTTQPLVRAADDDTSGRTITGIAVPFGEVIDLMPGFREQVAPGAVVEHDPQLWWRHDEPIGVITTARDEATGWVIEATISDTVQGRDAATLVRDGAVTSLSIGFQPLEFTETRDDDGTVTITHTKVRVREVSVVPHPAYSSASITEVRNRKEPTMTDTSATELSEVRAEVADLARQLRTLPTTTAPEPTDHRSAGTLIRAALNGDDTARQTLERAYTGSSISDDFGKAVWAGDLTRLVEAADPLAGVMAEGALPETGMTLEFGQLKGNTISVAKQAKEGDKLPLGKVSVKTATANVETFGGAAELSVQVMKRSQAPLIDMHLRALAIAAGRQQAAAKVAAVNNATTANSSAAVTVTGGATGWKPWIAALTDLADAFTDQLGLSMASILVTKDLWVQLAQLADADGLPMLTMDGGPATNVGTADVPGFRRGRFLGVEMIRVPGLTTPCAYAKEAIRAYTSPLVRVTNDLSALDLTSAIGVYRFGAIAIELPGAVVPLTIA